MLLFPSRSPCRRAKYGQGFQVLSVCAGWLSAGYTPAGRKRCGSPLCRPELCGIGQHRSLVLTRGGSSSVALTPRASSASGSSGRMRHQGGEEGDSPPLTVPTVSAHRAQSVCSARRTSLGTYGLIMTCEWTSGYFLLYTLEFCGVGFYCGASICSTLYHPLRRITHPPIYVSISVSTYMYPYIHVEHTSNT